MYLAVKPQPDCLSAWREAVRAVDAQPGHAAYNVIVDVADPTSRASLADPAVAAMSTFLAGKGKKPIETVANTIFPASLERRYGAPAFFDVFHDRVLPKVRLKKRWSGYYFERMMALPTHDGRTVNQIWDIVQRLRNPKVTALNKFELAVFDPARDVDGSPRGGHCMSFASLKLTGPRGNRRLSMTVMYRNHFYIEKLLGNLIGLGRLLEFIAREGKVAMGSLTIVSTHAEIDMDNWNRDELKAMLAECDQAGAQLAAPA